MTSVPFWLCVVLVAALACGCQTRRDTPPSTRAGIGDFAFAQDGAAAVPGAAASKTARLETTIPPGVEVTAHPDGSVTWRTAEPLRMVTTTREDSATGPAGFAPPTPPSPAEQARGFGVRAFYLAGLGCALAAGLALWRGYPLAALCLAGAAAGLPLVANVVSSAAGILVGGVFVALAAGLVVAYKLTARRDAVGVPAARSDTVAA